MYTQLNLHILSTWVNEFSHVYTVMELLPSQETEYLQYLRKLPYVLRQSISLLLLAWAFADLIFYNYKLVSVVLEFHINGNIQ